MAYMLALTFLVATGRIVVVAGEADEMPDVGEHAVGSEIGVHPVTGNMTVNGFDVMTGYSTADYPSTTFE
ncbi:hypothetical protein [Trinickia mobilis]|uniref:hypothetical protein n=1 Tax=Trinickia mobilis TaxID=2816356 RepID=UPI001A8C26B8|nr:hypothetical protein [Trinickia mobilis]